MKNIYTIICLAALCCISCKQQAVQHLTGTAFGTMFNITYLGEPSATLPHLVDSVLKEVNSTFSIFDTASLISHINSGEDLALNDDFATVLSKSLSISKQTDGAFDCTCQPLIELWGFGREQQKHVVPQNEIDSIKQFVGCQMVSIQDSHVVKGDPRIQLNFNAIAKGFAVDKVADFLQAQGFKDCLVEIGGEIVARGTKNGKPWKVGIQVPTETADGAIESSKSFTLQDRAVATSGNYRNYFEADGVRYTHILNPVTGKPEQTNLLSVTVIAPDCTTADAYATAFMVLGLERSSQIVRTHKELEAWFIYSEGEKFKTSKVNN